MAAPNAMDNRLKALDVMNTPGQNNVGSTISAMNLAQQKAQKSGQALDLGELAQQATQQVGKKVVDQQKEQAQTSLGIQQAQLGQQAQETELALAQREEALKASVQEQEMTLRRLSTRLAQELHEDTTQFKRDEIGRAYLNEKQLADYAVLQAKSQEELQGFMQVQAQMHEKKSQMLKVAYQKIEQVLKQITDSQLQNDRLQFDAEQQKAQQELQNYLIQAMRSLKEKMAQEQREAQQAAAGWGIFSSGIQGAVSGGAVGGLPGAIIGGAGGLVTGAMAAQAAK